MNDEEKTVSIYIVTDGEIIQVDMVSEIMIMDDGAMRMARAKNGTTNITFCG